MKSIEKVKEEIAMATTCVALCAVLLDSESPTGAKALTAPDSEQKLQELIQTPNDILELEKALWGSIPHRPLVAILSPIYKRIFMGHIEETARIIQQDFSQVDLLSWLTYDERKLIVEAFDSTLADTITNQQLGSLLSYLDPDSQEFILKKIENRLPILVQTFEDTLIFQNVFSHVPPSKLVKDIIPTILEAQPLEKIAAIINNSQYYKNNTKIQRWEERMRHQQSLDILYGVRYSPDPMVADISVLLFCFYHNCYKYEEELFTAFAHLNSAACTAMLSLILIDHEDNYLNVMQPDSVFALTTTLRKYKRNDLFTNLLLRAHCQKEIESILQALEKPSDITSYPPTEIFDLLWSSLFWFESSEYNDKILMPLANVGILAGIITTHAMLDKLLQSLHESNRPIVLELLKDQLPQLLASAYSPARTQSNTTVSLAPPSSSTSAFFNVSPPSRKRQREGDTPEGSRDAKRSCMARTGSP